MPAGGDLGSVVLAFQHNKDSALSGYCHTHTHIQHRFYLYVKIKDIRVEVVKAIFRYLKYVF